MPDAEPPPPQHMCWFIVLQCCPTCGWVASQWCKAPQLNTLRSYKSPGKFEPLLLHNLATTCSAQMLAEGLCVRDPPFCCHLFAKSAVLLLSRQVMQSKHTWPPDSMGKEGCLQPVCCSRSHPPLGADPIHPAPCTAASHCRCTS